MSWYRTGTITVTHGSPIVTGAGTSWVNAILPGWQLPGPDGKPYEIQSVDSATQITLTTNYLGVTASGQDYAIIPTQGLESSLAASLQTLISNYQSVYSNAGQGKFGAGTAGAPGISFSADTETGLYSPGASELAVVVGGILQALFSTTGFSYTGTLTGGAGIINIGSGQVYKDGAGNVGIGTTTPGEKLDVNGNALISGTLLVGGQDISAADEAFAANEGEIATIVGQMWRELSSLPTDAPVTENALFQVLSALGQIAKQVNGGRVTLAGGTLADPAIKIGTVGIYSAAADTLSVAVAGVEIFRITAAGISYHGTSTTF